MVVRLKTKRICIQGQISVEVLMPVWLQFLLKWFLNTCDSKHVSNNAWRNTGCLSVTDSPVKNCYYRILYISTIFFKHDFERNSCYHWCFCFILKALLHMVLCYLIKWCNKMLSQKGALSSSLLIWGNSNSYSLRPKSAKTHMSCESLW